MAIDVSFIKQVDSPRFCEQLFAVLPDVMFCIKDTARCYRAMNQGFSDRTGNKDARRLIGRRAEDVFPPALADVFREQDEQVLAGSEIIDQLELSTNRDGTQGWYLATKVPLHDSEGNVIGLAAVSRDLRAPQEGDAELAGIAKIAEYVRDHLDEPLRASGLATMADLSPTQLERRMRRVFQLSTTQFIRKSRIEHAAKLLRETTTAIAVVALECGYGDQTALTRQFRATVGMPPAAYRDHMKRRRA